MNSNDFSDNFISIPFSMETVLLCTAKVCRGDIEHVYCIWVTSHFAYVELWITRSIFSIPLDFEIMSLSCMRLCHTFYPF